MKLAWGVFVYAKRDNYILRVQPKSSNCIFKISCNISGKQISDSYQLFTDISNGRNRRKSLSASYEYLLKVIV